MPQERQPERQIATAPEPCPRCEALGSIDPDCPRCGGKGTMCPRCKGMGWLLPDNGGELKQCPCGLVYTRLARTQTMTELSALRGRLLACTFENFDTDGLESRYATEAYNAARAWAEAPVGFLTIHSPIKGNGKTHLAAAAANYLVAHGRSVLFVNSPELMDRLRACYDDDDRETVAELTSRVKAAPVLIVDDFGVEKRSAWTDERAYLIVNYRLEHNLPTLFTTNLPLDLLEDRIRSRIANRGGWLSITGQGSTDDDR